MLAAAGRAEVVGMAVEAVAIGSEVLEAEVTATAAVTDGKAAVVPDIVETSDTRLSECEWRWA